MGWESEFKASRRMNWNMNLSGLRSVFKIIGLILLVLIVIGLIVYGAMFLFSKINEDNWIKDSKGVWIMHGNPSSTPSEVLEQQDALSCASVIYATAYIGNVTFNSQCLGKCGDYSVDIVNVPRTSDDDLKENQCSDYADGITKHFIELDKNGTIVRIK
jgi:hypothetical protein